MNNEFVFTGKPVTIEDVFEKCKVINEQIFGNVLDIKYSYENDYKSFVFISYITISIYIEIGDEIEFFYNGEGEDYEEIIVKDGLLEFSSRTPGGIRYWIEDVFLNELSKSYNGKFSYEYEYDDGRIIPLDRNKYNTHKNYLNNYDKFKLKDWDYYKTINTISDKPDEFAIVDLTNKINKYYRINKLKRINNETRRN